MSHTKSLKYRPDIDGLRALAVLSVVIFHAFPEFMIGGFIGVDIFFVISGYLISTILSRSLELGNFSFLDFYSRRIRRIFPALSTVLIVCLIFGYFSLFSEEYKNLGKQTVAGVFFYSNFDFLRDFTDYFNPLSEQKPLLHLWSLAIEEQFYILWPLLLFLTHKFKRNLILVTVILTFISFGLNIWNIYSDPVRTFYLPSTRVWELLSGSLLAWYHQFKKKVADPDKNPIFPELQSVLGILCIFLGIFLIKKGSAFPGFLALVPVLGAVLLINSGNRSRFNRKVLGNPISIFFGLISFPLYLWHWPLLSFANILEGGTPIWQIRVLAVFISILFSYLTWAFLEKKIRFKESRYISIILVILLVSIGIVGRFIYTNQGLKFRGREFETSDLTFQKWSFTQKDCREEFKTALGQGLTYCSYTDSNQNPEIALIGDSHSEHFYYGLSEYYRIKQNKNLILLGMSACPILAGVTKYRNFECSITQRILKYVSDSESIKTVILSGRGPTHMTGKGFGEIENHIDARMVTSLNTSLKDSKEIYKISLFETVRKLQSSGKKVILISDNPELGFDPKACGNQRPFRLTYYGVKNPCAVSRREFDERNQDYHKILDYISDSFPINEVKIWEPWKQLCDQYWCWAIKDGKLMYRDGNHLNPEGSKWLGERFAPK